MNAKEKALQEARIKHDCPKGLVPFTMKQPLIRGYAKGWWILEEDYHFKRKVRYKKKNYFIDIVVPKGTKWDGCSAPRWSKNFINGSNGPEKILGGMIHDYLYQMGDYPKRVADYVFYILLKEHYVKNYIARSMQAAVIVAGSGPWDGHRQRQREAGY